VQNADGSESENVLTVDSRFFKKFQETKITTDIIAEPVNKWLELLNSPFLIMIGIAILLFVVGTMVLPNIIGR
jgi:hypothetical protein